ncbi:MAG: hypothetical protein K2O33_06405 [Muribaculaceae bacterium]|nr:hypothetical protein [Muribaculaceae bacterium]
MDKNGTKRCGCGSRKTDKASAEKHSHAINNYPGTSVDVADCEHVTPSEVKERTKTLNNNPRNSGQ